MSKLVERESDSLKIAKIKRCIGVKRYEIYLSLNIRVKEGGVHEE